MKEGDIVYIKGEKKHGKAKVQRVTGTTVTLETPLDGFRLWHMDDLEPIREKEQDDGTTAQFT